MLFAYSFDALDGEINHAIYRLFLSIILRYSSPMDERRRLERFGLRIPASLEVVHSPEEREMLNLLTTNICSGGAFFATSLALPEGTDVKIDLILPLDKLRSLAMEYHRARIELTGKVLRSGSTGMAVTFDPEYVIRPWAGPGGGSEHIS